MTTLLNLMPLPRVGQGHYHSFQLYTPSAGSAGVSPADSPPRKAAKMAALPGFTHVKTAVADGFAELVQRFSGCLRNLTNFVQRKNLLSLDPKGVER